MTALATRPTPVNFLSADEASALGRLERAIHRDLDVLDSVLPIAARVGKHLREIRDRRLYRATHATFADYFGDRFGRDRSYAYRLIAAGDVVDNLQALPIGSADTPPVLPAVESQARPLVGLAPEQQRTAWKEATAAAGGRQPTAAQVKAAADRVKGKPSSSVARTLRLVEDTKPVRAATSADEPAVNLVEKYRPRTLAEVIGQSEVVLQLQAFLAAPASAAFVFAGETGIGKTSAALALAGDLGCDVTQDGLGGLHTISSGDHVAESVRGALRALHLHPMFGSGWRVLIVDEADRMSESASHVWLDALEALPPKTVVIFTTNHVGRLDRRFRTRCEAMQFESSVSAVEQAAQARIDDVWRRETGRADAPRVVDLPGAIEDGELSIRACLQALHPLVRMAKRKRAESPAAPPVPSADLARIVERWPSLPASVRVQVLALVDAANLR